MIKKFISSVAMSTLMFSGVAVAGETYFSPEITSSGTSGTPWTFSGLSNVQRGFNLPCTIDLTLKGGPSSSAGHPSGSHTDITDISGADIWFTGGGGQCNAIGLTDRSSTGPIEFNPITHEFKLHNTKISTITLGYCEGTLGSGLIDHSQKMTVAARATAEKKAFGHLS